jgi:hypothetical protein
VRDVRLFRTKHDYEAFVRDEIVSERLLSEHPFYARLIQFVIDAKAPVFYRQTDPSEHANFSAYYNFVLARETYTNPTLRSMYFLHDFAHMLFYYPHDMTSVGQAEFDDTVIAGEYAASNETEILAHYRVKGLRERVLQDRRIFFDLLRERGVAQPSVASLGHLRRWLVETDHLDPYFFQKPEDEPVRATLKGYRGNGAWCKKRFEETLKLPHPTEFSYRFLTPVNYERVLSTYESSSTQADYERTVLMNVRLAFALLRLERPPRAFGECLERVSELEGKVFFRG